MNTFKKKPKLKTPAGTKNSDALTKSAGVKGRRAGFPTSGPEAGEGPRFPLPAPPVGFRARLCVHSSGAPAPALGLLQEAGRGVRVPLGAHVPAGCSPAALPEPPEEGCRRRRLRRSPPIPGMLDVGCRGADCSSEMKAEHSPRGGGLGRHFSPAHSTRLRPFLKVHRLLVGRLQGATGTFRR